MFIPKFPVGRFNLIVTAVAIAMIATSGPTSSIALADTTPPAGAPPTVSADRLPTWQINGVVWSQVLVGTVVCATGNFTKARPPGVAVGGPGQIPAGNIFAFDVRTGNPVPTFNHTLNGQGRTITASPDGSRVYVGGSFTAVDGVARGHLAAFITANGALDPAFRPAVNSDVRALGATGTTLYVGGIFQNVGGNVRRKLAAVNSSDGAVLQWAPTADDGDVWSLVVAPDRSRVIVGGSFTTLNKKSAYGMGSLNAADGSVLPWAANKTIRDATNTGAITSLRTDGRQIYGSGYAFGAGSSFEGTFAADPTTGVIKFLNDCHGDTYDVLPIGPILYSVSHVHDCTAVGGFPDVNPRNLTQRTLAQTIAANNVNKGPDAYGWNYNGWPASTILHWFPNLTPGSFTGQAQAAWSLAGSSDYVVLGGEFPTVNGVAQQGLTRMAIERNAPPNKMGPTYTKKTSPSPIPPTTAASIGQGTVKVTFGSAWDYDNATLDYQVFRDNATVVYTTSVTTNFWTLPTLSFTDTGLAHGSSHFYQVHITDPFHNTLLSPRSNTVTS